MSKKQQKKQENTAVKPVCTDADLEQQDSAVIRKNKRKNIIKLSVLGLLLVIGVVITIRYLPFFQKLYKDQTALQDFTQHIRDMGWLGWFMVLGIQILQVVVAIIPGEPVEILSGMLYGSFGGLLTCLLGLCIGTILIFYMVKILGASFVEKVISKEKFTRLKFLHNSKRLEILTFILFFIPGTPKDLLTYFVPLTTIKAGRFFLISTFARIPSVITSTFAGASLSKGNLLQMIIILGVTGAIGIAGICLNEKLMNMFNKMRGNAKKKLHEKNQL